MRKEFATLLLLVVLCVIVTALNPRFMSPANLQNTARLIGAFGIFSLGLGLVIITGGIDLSVGSAFALLGVLLSIMLTEWHLAWPVAVLAVVALGAVLGALHGLLSLAWGCSRSLSRSAGCCCIAALPDSSPTTRQRDLATPPGSRPCNYW